MVFHLPNPWNKTYMALKVNKYWLQTTKESLFVFIFEQKSCRFYPECAWIFFSMDDFTNINTKMTCVFVFFNFLLNI